MSDAPLVTPPLKALKYQLAAELEDLAKFCKDEELPLTFSDTDEVHPEVLAHIDGTYRRFAAEAKKYPTDTWENEYKHSEFAYPNNDRSYPGAVTGYAPIRTHFLAKIAQNEEIPANLRLYAAFTLAESYDRPEKVIAWARLGVALAEKAQMRQLWHYRHHAAENFSRLYHATRFLGNYDIEKLKRAELRLALSDLPWLEQGHPSRIHEFFRAKHDVGL